MLAVPSAQVAHSIREFCDAHRISIGTFYNLVRRGEAPNIMRVGRRVLISEDAAAEWRRAHAVAA
jgi:hypothetical protein